jgi:hypothetical protein
MPVNMTFTSLQTDLQNYIERGQAVSDPTVNAQIPSIINLTERKIARELKIQGFQRFAISAMQANLSVYQKPTGWRENISMSIGTGVGFNTWVPIYTRDFEYVRAYWPDATQVAQPKYYADMGYSDWWFSPTPDQAYPFQAVYWELPPQLDAANVTNWLTTYAPNALLHGCLVELYGFLKNATELAVWQPIYDRDMAALSGEDLQKILDRTQQRKTS